MMNLLAFLGLILQNPPFWPKKQGKLHKKIARNLFLGEIQTL
jgi:hypothetical protein